MTVALRGNEQPDAGGARAASGRAPMAPGVLIRLLGLALGEVAGVARLGTAPGRHAAPPDTHRGPGVAVQISAEGVRADCYIVAEAGANLREVGLAAQLAAAAVVQELAGMPVREVNMYIQDVEASNG